MGRIEFNSFESNDGEGMRRWYLPMTVVGLGGLGVLLFTERGRRSLEWLMEQLPDAPKHFAEWNEAAQRELDHIQAALDEVAKTLDEGPQSAYSH